VFRIEAQLPGRQLAQDASVAASHKPVSGQSTDVDGSLATSAFAGTNPTGELITSGLPVNR